MKPELFWWKIVLIVVAASRLLRIASEEYGSEKIPLFWTKLLRHVGA